MTDVFEMIMPDDMHLHLRQAAMLRAVVPETERQFARALVMPNTRPAIRSAYDVRHYREEVLAATIGSGFEPLMTIQILESTTPAMIGEALEEGAIAGKIYPDGVTTNSEGGVTNFHSLYPTLSAMQEQGMVLCLHGEVPGDVFCLDREELFLATLKQLVRDFPKLKIVLEHVTTRKAVEVVLSLPATVAATITVHHLFLTLDDVVGGLIKPHHFCKPIAKRPVDREALVTSALSGNPKFFLGTDSAPHEIATKECAQGCAGVFTAPVAMPLLATLFDRHETLAKLEGFASRLGAEFYGLPTNEKVLTLTRSSWTVPDSIGIPGVHIVPFMAGETLLWQVAS